MIKFYRCTYDEYQYIWLKERINNFLVIHLSAAHSVDQLVDQFLTLNQNQDRETVKKTIQQILKENNVTL